MTQTRPAPPPGGIAGTAATAGTGFEVVGVDIEPQPDYPYEFMQMDGLDVLRGDLSPYSAIHMAWPCQAYTPFQKGSNKRLNRTYPKLTEMGRFLAERTGLPFVIENPAARADVVLCGEMFGLDVIRHRKFELGGWKAEQPEHVKHRGRIIGYRHGVKYEGVYYAVYGSGGGKGTVEEWRNAMGIHWTWDRKSIAEATPPAYTEWVGTALMQHLQEETA